MLLAVSTPSILNIFKALSPLNKYTSPFQLSLPDYFGAVFTKKWPQFNLGPTWSHLWLCKPWKKLFSAIWSAYVIITACVRLQVSPTTAAVVSSQQCHRLWMSWLLPSLKTAQHPSMPLWSVGTSTVFTSQVRSPRVCLAFSVCIAVFVFAADFENQIGCLSTSGPALMPL